MSWSNSNSTSTSFYKLVLKYPAVWRHNPQPYRYPIPFPQYIHNICVVCYEEKDDCSRRYPPGAAKEEHFHQPPYFITSSNPQQDYYETPEIGRLPFIIAEHHCFAQFAVTEDFDFQLYDLQPEGTKLTYEKTLFYKNFLITKWTKESALHINNAVEWETYRFFSNLWGSSPYAEWKWNQWRNKGRHNNTITANRYNMTRPTPYEYESQEEATNVRDNSSPEWASNRSSSNSTIYLPANKRIKYEIEDLPPIQPSEAPSSTSHIFWLVNKHQKQRTTMDRGK